MGVSTAEECAPKRSEVGHVTYFLGVSWEPGCTKS
jgi:hypothetical protein